MNFENILQSNLTDAALKLEEGSEFIDEIKDFIVQQQVYSGAIKEVRTKLEILDEEFKVKYDHNPIHHIESRLKSPQSIIEKLKRRDLKVELESIWHGLTDVAGVRVVANYIDDIYRIADMLVRQDDVILMAKRDYIENPKPNGYRSLHLIIKVPVFLAEKTEQVSVEVQIRTIAMDFWASLEHMLKYKTDEDIREDLRERLSVCATSIAELDQEMQAIHKEIKGTK